MEIMDLPVHYSSGEGSRQDIMIGNSSAHQQTLWKPREPRDECVKFRGKEP